jgi:hypothetical protein
VGVTHLDEAPDGPDEVFHRVRELLEIPEDSGLVACDPRSKDDVKGLMLQILMGVMARLERAAAAG